MSPRVIAYLGRVAPTAVGRNRLADKTCLESLRGMVSQQVIQRAAASPHRHPRASGVIVLFHRDG